MEQSLAGQLLLAGPNLQDPNFARTVVLVGVHGEEGAMGLVLNRPAPITVADAVPQLEAVVGEHEPVYVGGRDRCGAVQDEAHCPLLAVHADEHDGACEVGVLKVRAG